jgi:hypothetical protein
VSDIARAKALYAEQIGFGVEQHLRVDERHRFVELRPPGSPCSIALTIDDIDATPGSLRGLQSQRRRRRSGANILPDRGVNRIRHRGFPCGRFCLFSDPDANGSEPELVVLRDARRSSISSASLHEDRSSARRFRF